MRFLAPDQPAGSDGGLAATTPASPLGNGGAAAVTASASSQRENDASASELAVESSVPDSEVPGSPPASPRLSLERDPGLGIPEVFAGEGEAVELVSEESTAQTFPDGATDVVAALTDAPSGAGLAVPQSGVGTDVVDRQLVGRADTFRVGTRVVFWTQIVGGRPGDSVRHVWLHNGQTIGIVELPVGGPSWRTQSRRTMAPDASGSWVVEARDSEGHVLARHEFRCEP